MKNDPYCVCGIPQQLHRNSTGECLDPSVGCTKFKPAKSANKYRAVKTEFNGEIFDSKLEAKYVSDYEYMKRSGSIRDYRIEPEIKLEAYGKLICKYYPDIEVTHLDGTTEYIEVKGKWTPLAKIKWKMFRAKMEGKKKIKLTVAH